MSFRVDFTTVPLPLLPKGRKRLVLQLSSEDEEVQQVAEKSLKRPRESEAVVAPLSKRQRKEIKQKQAEEARTLMKEANVQAWGAKEKRDLDRAIRKYRKAFEMALKDEWLKSVILLNWGNALMKRNNPAKQLTQPLELFTPDDRLLYGELSDADQAIAKYSQGLVCIKHDEDVDGRLRLGQGKAHLAKYEASKDEQELILALQCIQEGLHPRLKNHEIRAGLHKAEGNARCLGQDYKTGIQCYRDALALSFDNEVLRENIHKCLEEALVHLPQEQSPASLPLEQSPASA